MDKSTVVTVFTDSILEDASVLDKFNRALYKSPPLEGFIRSTRRGAEFLVIPIFARQAQVQGQS